jgi:hypothetical protein
MQYSFSKFFSFQVYFGCSLIKGREKKKKKCLETVLRMVSAAVARLPTAVSLLLLEALFMQISGVSLALTWPRRLCLFRVLLCGSLCYRLSPFQGDTASALSGLRVYLQFMWEVGLPSSPVKFSSHRHFHKLSCS